MSKIRVGIIDTGIEKKIFDNVDLTCYKLYIDSDNYINLVTDDNDIDGHGTLVFSSLLSEINDTKNVEFISISITDSSISSIELLIESIKLMQSFNVEILNISMSIDYDRKFIDKELYCLIEKNKKNMVIFCSEYNGKCNTIPASYPNVVGVNSIYLGTESNYFVDSMKMKNIVMNCRSKLLINNKGKYEFFGDSTSFATSILTGIIVNDIERNIKKFKLCNDKLEYIFNIIKNNNKRIDRIKEIDIDKIFSKVDYSKKQEYIYSNILESYFYKDYIIISSNKFNKEYIINFVDFLKSIYSIDINKNNIRLFDFFSEKTLMNFLHRNMNT